MISGIPPAALATIGIPLASVSIGQAKWLVKAAGEDRRVR